MADTTDSSQGNHDNLPPAAEPPAPSASAANGEEPVAGTKRPAEAAPDSTPPENKLPRPANLSSSGNTLPPTLSGPLSSNDGGSVQNTPSIPQLPPISTAAPSSLTFSSEPNLRQIGVNMGMGMEPSQMGLSSAGLSGGPSVQLPLPNPLQVPSGQGAFTGGLPNPLPGASQLVMQSSPLQLQQPSLSSLSGQQPLQSAQQIQQQIHSQGLNLANKVGVFFCMALCSLFRISHYFGFCVSAPTDAVVRLLFTKWQQYLNVGRSRLRCARAEPNWTTPSAAGDVTWLFLMPSFECVDCCGRS
jgi:hypothetical protein